MAHIKRGDMMQISLFDVPRQKKLECETRFHDKLLASGQNEDGLFDLVFKDAAINTVNYDGVAIHDKSNIVYFDNCDFSIIKIL